MSVKVVGCLEVDARNNIRTKMAEMELPRMIDNVASRLVDDLRDSLKAGSKVSVAAATFSMYAFGELREELQGIDRLRFLFTSPAFLKSGSKKEKKEFYIPRLSRERSLYGSEFEIRLRNELSLKAIAHECAEWIRKKATFRANASDAVIPGLLHVAGDSPTVYYPINGFTTTDLGVERGNEAFTIINAFPGSMANGYLSMFNSMWNDAERTEDVTETVLEYIENAYKENSPELIYFITLYHIFHEFLEDISEDVLPNEATGFKESVIWNKLYNFQRDAALAIINKLERYNGCILADSVGLGKTFTALAVIKYYEKRNKSVLVLCPKKLNDNWIAYKSNYKGNPLAKDRLRYDVFFHTDLSRRGGTSNGQDLNKIDWGNYDLLVIDESHNFRNGGHLTDDDGDEEQGEGAKVNRYATLMTRIIRPGVKTKVLMLSATPVNNGFSDLKNQLALAYEGHSERLDAMLDTDKRIDTIFREAQKQYNAWIRLPEKQRTTRQLMNRLSPDFFTLLDSVTIARSRSHIRKYYDTRDIGEFPTRLKPITRRPHLTDIEGACNYKEIYKLLSRLNLAVYTPSAYLLGSRKSVYADDDPEYGGISREGRELGMLRFMRAALLKRLESSVNSFRLTVGRIEAEIDTKLSLVDKHSGQLSGLSDKTAEDLADDDAYDPTFTSGGEDISIEDMDYRSWGARLEEDKAILQQLTGMVKDITPEYDAKLRQLRFDIQHKIEHPINGDNRKIIIFTAFSDTAVYLYNNIAPWVKKQFGLDTALITGTIPGRCTNPKVRADFNEVLKHFSPVSKERPADEPHHDIDVLIATDCISEGQNLQDCDWLINYDIHWNPVRIIQRFGRIDRIGSRNKQIQLVNYWPDVELDEYIKLKGRVESRMKATVLTATGDDNLLSDEEKGDLEYRKRQLQRLQEEVVDIEDMDTGINIMDLGLNDFRQDLLAYVKEHPDVEHSPLGMHAVAQAAGVVKPGVIYVLRNRNRAVNIERQNALHPFYMVYIAYDGAIVCNHLSYKTMLDTMRAACRGRSEPLLALCRQVNKETEDGRNMKKYSELLRGAVSSIVGVKEQSDATAFLRGEQVLFKEEIKGLDDFELISFLIIR